MEGVMGRGGALGRCASRGWETRGREGGRGWSNKYTNLRASYFEIETILLKDDGYSLVPCLHRFQSLWVNFMAREKTHVHVITYTYMIASTLI